MAALFFALVMLFLFPVLAFDGHLQKRSSRADLLIGIVADVEPPTGDAHAGCGLGSFGPSMAEGPNDKRSPELYMIGFTFKKDLTIA